MKRTIIALGLSLASMIALATPAAVQTPGFDVASVKPSNPNPTGPLGGAPMVLPALGRLTAQNVTLRILAMAAYQKQPFEISGGPPWQNQNKFDITATTENRAATTDQLLGMLQTLLADRFKLKTHVEKRDVAIYALMLARDDRRFGQKLKASTAECPDFKTQRQEQLEALAKGGLAALAAAAPKPGENRPCAVASAPAGPGLIGIRATGQTMALLATVLTQLVGRPVVDKTGLEGLYDFDFTVDLQTLMRIAAEMGISNPMPQNLPEGPSLMTQLQEDLGLKLDSQRGPGEVLVIDSAEMPLPD
jgi:uncharacterized protein (TIGR03435 family)